MVLQKKGFGRDGIMILYCLNQRRGTRPLRILETYDNVSFKSIQLYLKKELHQFLLVVKGDLQILGWTNRSCRVSHMLCIQRFCVLWFREHLGSVSEEDFTNFLWWLKSNVEVQTNSVEASIRALWVGKHSDRSAVLGSDTHSPNSY